MSSLTRIPPGPYAGAIGAAADLLPARIADRLAHVQFVCGVDPVFAGVHSYGDMPADGRSYRVTPHCCQPWHLDGPADRKVTTIVLPTPAGARPETVVHELGHALHPIAGFDVTPAPVSSYAATSRYEAFAEAFTAWLVPGYGDADVLARDHRTLAVLEDLAA